MKSILRFKSLAVIFCLSLSLGAALAQMNLAGGAPAPGAFEPTTGAPTATMTITSGMMPEWKDANWKDPDIILSNVSYDSFPLGELAINLSSAVNEQFDVLLPSPSS